RRSRSATTPGSPRTCSSGPASRSATAPSSARDRPCLPTCRRGRCASAPPPGRSRIESFEVEPNMSRRLLSFLASRLPPRWIRWGGRLRDRFPVFSPVVQWLARDLLAAEGIIRHGIGAGLRFDARSGSAGYLFGTAEPQEQAALAHYLKADDVFYDIGANIGFFAVLAARLVGSSGRVYAFEPNPACSSQVRRNADLNGFSHVEVVEAAVSSTSGHARLRLGGTNLSSAIAGESEPGIDVALISVEDFMRDTSQQTPALVMFYVQGAAFG